MQAPQNYILKEKKKRKNVPEIKVMNGYKSSNTGIQKDAHTHTPQQSWFSKIRMDEVN